MKIISWNCNMAFRKKWPSVVSMNPDILVIQECESPDKFKGTQEIPHTKSFLWYGLNQHKGIAIITFNNYKVSLREDYNEDFQYIIPLVVTKGDESFDLYAIWAMPHKNKRNGYVGQIWNALQYYENNKSKHSIYVGDFNSNQIWDKERPVGNHSHVREQLEGQDLISVYHHLRAEEHGQELTPTIYLLKQMKKPYHLDYCFVPLSWITRQTTISVGNPAVWMPLSDHMPVIVDHLRLR